MPTLRFEAPRTTVATEGSSPNLSQQVGSGNCAELNEGLGAAPMSGTPMVDGESWTLADAVEGLERHGATILDAEMPSDGVVRAP